MHDPAPQPVTDDLPDRQPLQIQQPRPGRNDTLGDNLNVRTLNLDTPHPVIASSKWGQMGLSHSPERFGNWNSIYGRFSEWSKDGTWLRVLATVQGASHRAGDLDWTVSVDSTITRVHQHGASLPRDTGDSRRVTRNWAPTSPLTMRSASPAAG